MPLMFGSAGWDVAFLEYVASFRCQPRRKRACREIVRGDIAAKIHIYVYTYVYSENKFSPPAEFAAAFLAPMGEISGDVPKTLKNDDPESGP